MISRSGYLSFVASILFVGTILVFSYQSSKFESITLQVIASKGQTIEEFGDVVLPGDAMKPGEIYRVIGSELAVSDKKSRTQIVFQTPSRVQLAPPTGGNGHHLIHYEGVGSSETRGSKIVHTWTGVGPSGNEPRLIQKSGITSWRIQSNQIHLQLSDDFVGHWSFQGQAMNIAKAKKYRSLSVDRKEIESIQFPERSSKFLDPRPASIISPERLISWIGNWKENGRQSSSIRQVTGHWIRDFWGNVYLYRPANDGGFTLVSSGPDEKFLTQDDKRWTIRPGK